MHNFLNGKSAAMMLALSLVNVTAAFAQDDNSSAKEEGNRNVMLNAASANGPREIQIGLPSADVNVLENGLPVTTNGLFDGLITDMAIQTGENSALSISISSIFNSWLRGFPYRYTEESHSSRNDNDRFFKYVDQVASRPIIWEV